MPGRNYTSAGYRYGFNGMEKDDEVKGNNNSLDFGARIYDPRVGRWLSTDPLQAKYPSLSPYNFVADNPIIFIDPDGRKIRGVKYNSSTGQYEFKKSALKRGTDKYIAARTQTETGRAAIANLINHNKTFTISVTDEILVGQVSADKYTLIGGETDPGNFIVISTNQTKGSELANSGNPSDILNVATVDQNGNVIPTKIKRSNLVRTLGNTQAEDQFTQEYNQAYEDSGMKDFENDGANEMKPGEQYIHGTGAHEETHLLEKDGLSTYSSEKSAFENEKKERIEYNEKDK